MLSPGEMLQGRYRIDALLQQGGMGSVYAGFDIALETAVAIKAMRGTFSSPAERQAAADQFQREARILARLQHAGLPRVSNFFDTGETSYLVMDLIQGESLEHILTRSGPLPERLALTWAKSIAEVLDFLHKQNVIFRDMKPSNVMLGTDGTIKVIDFGLSVGPQRGHGTPGYAPPEQYANSPSPTDARSDVYSLGCTLYTFLTAQVPPEAKARLTAGDQPMSVRQQHKSLSGGIDKLVARATALKPEKRHASMAALLSELQKLLGSPITIDTLPAQYRAHNRAPQLPAVAPLPDTLVPVAVTPATQKAPLVPAARSGRELVQRPPRMALALPTGEEQIKYPPAPPQTGMKLGEAILKMVVPNLAVQGVAIGATMMRGGTVQQALMIYLPTTGAQVLVAGVQTFTRRRQDKVKIKAHQDTWTQYCAETRQKLLDAQRQQRQALLENDPDPTGCTARVRERRPTLWQRTPEHPDFLAVRVGLGEVPMSLSVKPPAAKDDTVGQDDLQRAAQALATDFQVVSEAPVNVPLNRLGACGIVGPRLTVINLVRSMIMAIATHHSPLEVKLVVFYPPTERERWAWVRWLPHVWSDDRRHRYVAESAEESEELLEQIDEVLRRREQSKKLPLPVYLLVLARPGLPAQKLDRIVRQGPTVGAAALFLGQARGEVPQACRILIDVNVTPSSLLELDDKGQLLAPHKFTPDMSGIAEAERLARSMAPLADRNASISKDLPLSITLLELLKIGSIKEWDVAGTWKRNATLETLPVPLGIKDDGTPLILDLDEKVHGPHGMLAGSTGSGKTVFLSGLLALLAAHFSPHHVTFVAIDVGKGELFRGLEGLPHMVGTLSNLEESMVQRALRGLRAEVRRRQQLCDAATKATGRKVDHIDDYTRLHQQGKVREPLPTLIVLVDEFTELKRNYKELFAQLESVARVGRILGIHLLLAAQTPAVEGDFMTNIRLRVALKCQEVAQSRAMLGTDDAADITVRGRGYLKADTEYMLFQSAYGGQPYEEPRSDKDDEFVLHEVDLRGHRAPLIPETVKSANPSASDRTQLQVLVAHLTEAAQAAGISKLPGPWLPPLEKDLCLTDLALSGGWNGETWDTAPARLAVQVGLLDDIDQPRQDPLVFDLTEGHLGIYGRVGSGTSTGLLTLLTSLSLAYSPSDLHVYALDFDGALSDYAVKPPHLADVAGPGDGERVLRLVKYLLRQVEVRRPVLRSRGCASWAQGREKLEGMPAIVLLIDNFARLLKEVPEAEDALVELTQDGLACGLHVVATALGPGSLRAKATQCLTQVVCLQLADKSEYVQVVGRDAEGQTPEPAPQAGRGLLSVNRRPVEFQFALPSPGENAQERMEALVNLWAEMDAWGGSRPGPVPTIPRELGLEQVFRPEDPSLAAGPGLAVPVGLSLEDVAPFHAALQQGPFFLVAGRARSGKTTLLRSWVLSLAAHLPPERLGLYLIDMGDGKLSPLSKLPHVRQVVQHGIQFKTVMEELGTELKTRQKTLRDAIRGSDGSLDEAAFVADLPALVVVVDDFSSLSNADTGIGPGAGQAPPDLLNNLLKSTKPLGFYLLLGVSLSDMVGSALLQTLRGRRTGFLVGSREDDGVYGGVKAQIRNELALGEGALVLGGNVTGTLKVARPDAGGPRELLEWVKRIADRWAPVAAVENVIAVPVTPAPAPAPEPAPLSLDDLRAQLMSEVPAGKPGRNLFLPDAE